MIQIHHLINSRSQRIIWLLEELNLDYEIVFHDRDPVTRMAGASLIAVHALGKAPFLVDGEIKLAESQAIVDYLIETYDKNLLAPKIKSPERVQYLYWKNFAEGSLMPLLSLCQLFSRTEQKIPFLFRFPVRALFNKVRHVYIWPQLKSALNSIEQHLNQNDYCAGKKFSAADILLTFMLDALMSSNARHYPNINTFLNRIKTRATYQSANQKDQWNLDYFVSYWTCLNIEKY